MSSPSISNLISSIKEQFQKLQNKLHSQKPSAPGNAPEQMKASARCLIVAGAEKAENLEKSSGNQWWARLYRGLVIDPDARHYRQMGQAVWLYLYFLLNANWKTGRLYRRLSTVCEDTGINRFAVRRWLRVLQRNGYVNACYNGRFWVIEVNKWRPLALPFVRNPKSSKFSKTSKYRRSQS